MSTNKNIRRNFVLIERFIAVLMFIFIPFLSPFSAYAGRADTIDVTIIHTSDIHAHLMPFDCASGTAMGGYARIKAYCDGLTARGRNVVILSSGDLFQGTLFYRFYRGIPDVGFMSQIGYSASVIGNHEFDGGQDGIYDAFRDAKFPLLAANLRFDSKSPLAGLIKPSTIVTLPCSGGSELKIGIIGITDEELEQDVQKVFLKGITIESAETALKREIRRLKAEKCDVILALTHVGWNRDLALADKFSEITGFLGGHTHLFVDPPLIREIAGNHQFISQTGEFGSHISRLDLHLEKTPQGMKCRVAAAGLIPMSSDLPENKAIKDTVDQLWKKVEEKTSEKLAETAGKLEGDRQLVRRQETNLGNLTADSFLYVLPAQIAVLNGGGIRNSIPAGPVRVADCLNVLPFDNYLVRLTMTGKSLQKLFEQVRSDFLSTPSYGGFLHVSRGFKVHYTKTGVELSYLGNPINPAATYTVVTNDFLSTGGNGLSPFTEAIASESSGILCADAMMKYVKSLKNIDAHIEGRIILDVQPAKAMIPIRRLHIPRPPID